MKGYQFRAVCGYVNQVTGDNRVLRAPERPGDLRAMRRPRPVLGLPGSTQRAGVISSAALVDGAVVLSGTLFQKDAAQKLMDQELFLSLDVNGERATWEMVDGVLNVGRWEIDAVRVMPATGMPWPLPAPEIGGLT